MAQQDSRVNIVMFGNISAVHFGPENILLGQEQSILRNTEVSQIVPVTSRVSGHNVSVIDILGLEETDLPPHTVPQFISRLVNENEIHAFIFVLQLNRLTDTDKLGLEWLKSTFGERALAFVMILFTYESEEECDTIIDDLKNNTVLEQLTQQCGGRYCTCSKSMNNQSEMGTLLENIDHLISENSQCCYTAEIYTAAFRGLRDRQNQQTAANRLLLQEEVDNKEDLTNQPEVISPKPDDEDCKPDFSEELKDLFSRVLGNHNQIIKSADILQIIKPLLQYQESSLHVAFLQKLLLVNYNARYISVDKQSREEPDFSPEPVGGVNGWSFMYSETFGVDFCTTAVSSNMLFFRTSAGVFAFKEYRKAGGDYAKWNISPDTSEMPYWKWFVCRFQEDLEKHYKRKFTGNGEIPHEWKEITKARAIESLSEL